jgi:hypothetical protein
MDYVYKSPYDYAENRPVSGIDLDGLEYEDRKKNTDQQKDMAHKKKLEKAANDAGKKVFQNTKIGIEASPWKWGGNINTRLVNGKIEVGVIKAGAEVSSSGVALNGKFLYGEGELSLKKGKQTSTIKGGGELVSGGVTVDQKLDVSSTSKFLSRNGSLELGRQNNEKSNTYAGVTTNGDIGFGATLGFIKAEIMVNVEAAATWFVETINSLDTFGAFDFAKVKANVNN